MSTEILRAFAADAAKLPAELESTLLAAVAETIAQKASRETKALLAGTGIADRCGTAVAAFAHMLSDHGFLVGRTAPGQAASEGCGIAQVWRAADANARVYRASTPALALARAALSEWADREDERARMHCPQCQGAGWYVTASGAREICHHGRPG